MRLYRRFVVFLLAAALPAALSAYVSPLPSPAAPPATPSLLLVASSKVIHPVFRETVILVTKHEDEGHIGIIVNRSLEIPLNLILPSLPGAEKHMLHRGGPVDPSQISFLFRGGDAEPGSLTVAKQTYFSSSASLLGQLLGGARNNSGLRVVSGYAGWAPEQLESEIARGDWHVLPVDSAILFDRPLAAIWPELYQRATQVSARQDRLKACGPRQTPAACKDQTKVARRGFF